jgi:hypothetical protein
MYESLRNMTGVGAATNWVGQIRFQTTTAPDGLTFSPPQEQSERFFGSVVFPDRLHAWLIDLRLLRHMPLAYLVPDSALLPPESIRFFHVDPTWMDRVIDGVFSTAAIGTAEITFTYAMLEQLRQALDSDLTGLAQQSVPTSDWTPKEPMTGVLIRSELVQRWPNLLVTPYSDLALNTPMAVLRSEPISKQLYIALFAGLPKTVGIREPNVGTRFGVEDIGGKLQVEKRADIPSKPTGLTTVNPRPGPATVLAIAGTPNAPGLGKDGRTVALQLERPAFNQIFTSDPGTPESTGYHPVTLQTEPLLRFSSGFVLDLTKHIAQLAQLPVQET